MGSDKLARSAVSLASLLTGLAIWEIAGRYTSPAFLVPFSETVARLSDLLADWGTWAQFLELGEVCSSPASRSRLSSACRPAFCSRASAQFGSGSSHTS